MVDLIVELILLAIIGLLFFLYINQRKEKQKMLRRLKAKLEENDQVKRSLDACKKACRNTKHVKKVEYAKYIVEVNEGIYLKIPNRFNTYNFRNEKVFVKNIHEATSFFTVEAAKSFADECGGKILYNKPNLEVVE